MDNKKVVNFAVIVIALSVALTSYSYYLRTSAYPEFQLIQLGEFRRDQFLLDKKTGRTWVGTCLGEPKGPDCDGEMIWQERVAVGLNGFSYDDLNRYLQMQTEKEKPKAKSK